MTRYVALLRAINVGGHTVAMSRLRALFGDLGLGNVETFIASGNVLFDAAERRAAALERRIAGHLETELGYAVATFLRTPPEIAAVAAREPFSPRALAAPGTRLFAAFLPDAPSAAAGRKAVGLSAPTDELKIHGREIYWLCRVPMNESAVSGAAIEKTLGMPVTVRNMTTVRKLAERVSRRRG